MRGPLCILSLPLLMAVACGGDGPAHLVDGDTGTTDTGGTGGTSDTGGPNGSGGRSAGSGGAFTGGDGSGGGSNGTCTNVRPTGTNWDAATCEQWATETEECEASWMVENGYCNQSCGRCQGGSPSGGAPSGGGGNTGGADDGSGGTVGGSGGSNQDPDHAKFVGNITTGFNNALDTNGLIYSEYWDQISPENAGKWGSVQQVAGGGFNWGSLDAIYDYAKSKGIIFKQHAFVWGQQQPGGSPSQNDVINWIRSFCERYPETKLIDVVNEPPPHTEPNYTGAIGGGTNGDWAWIKNSFTWARQYCPNAILILNDYNNIEWPNDNQHFIDIVNTVLDAGGPIDAVGAQSHDLDHAQVTPERVEMLLNKLHDDTGLPVYITEMDLDYSDDQQQLTAYQTYFPMFMDADFVPGITIWGWIYGSTWNKAPSSGLIRNGAPRPAMSWLMNELGRPVP